MRRSATLVAAVVATGLSLGTGPRAEAQSPIRIGASLSQTGSFAVLGQEQLRGYQLCVKHANEKGGVLGRRIELLVEDDQSNAATAVAIYERLITRDKVDAILGPYSSPITEAVADVNEKHKMPMVASVAATTSIFKKGRKFIFMVFPAAEVFLEGLVEMAANKGLKTLALINEDSIFPTAVAQGTIERAKKKGLQVVFTEAYPNGTTDFSAILSKVRAANPDVLGASSLYFDDAVAITRQSKALNINPKIFGVTVGGDLPKFYEVLSRDAEFVYGHLALDPELVTLRAGGLIPIARQYPGAREFVESYKKEFPLANLSPRSAAGYAGCQIFLEAVKRAGSLESERVRDAILKMDLHTVFGAFKVDRDGASRRRRGASASEEVHHAGRSSWESDPLAGSTGGILTYDGQSIMMSAMRTTLTLDDEVAMKLRELAHRRKVSFKEVVNSVLRRGLVAQESRGKSSRPFQVEAFRSAFRPGVDPLKLNQLSDELEARRFAETGQLRP